MASYVHLSHFPSLLSQSQPPCFTTLITPATQYSSIKELLTLSRKIKELWVFGPLGKEDPDRKVKEAQIDEDVAKVSGLLDQIEATNMKELAGKFGGTWEPLKKEDGESAAAGK